MGEMYFSGGSLPVSSGLNSTCTIFEELLLRVDYNMLEDVKRVADSAQRMRLELGGYPHFRLPFPLKSLRRAAASRRTKLLFLPSGMSKRETNQSYYNNRSLSF